MCLIILNTTGVVPQNEFANAWHSNPHGGGIAWVSDGKVKAWRTMKGHRTMYNKYLKEREFNQGVFLIHFRYATHGAKNIENTHPFKINPRLYFAHNGVMSEYGCSGLDKCSVSDSRDFGDKILSKLNPDFIYDAHMLKMLEKHIGAYNKIVLINGNNDFAILNERSGHWDHRKENWYSNFGYRPYTPPPKTTYLPPTPYKTLKELEQTKTSTTTSTTTNKVADVLPISKQSLLTPVTFENSSTWNKTNQRFETFIKTPWRLRFEIGGVWDKEITFAQLDCGLNPYINELDELVWGWSEDNNEGIEYSRREILKWMEDGTKNIL